MRSRRPGCVSPAERREIENLGGWLTTVIGRILNMLRSRKARREEPLDATCRSRSSSVEGADPEHEAL